MERKMEHLGDAAATAVDIETNPFGVALIG
jgi:hypothetical protein